MNHQPHGRTRFRSEFFCKNYHLPTSEIMRYIEEIGFDSSLDSYEFAAELRSHYNCSVPKQSLALACLLSGYILIPGKAGSFTFEWADQ
jgi:hypothetical protein